MKTTSSRIKWTQGTLPTGAPEPNTIISGIEEDEQTGHRIGGAVVQVKPGVPEKYSVPEKGPEGDYDRGILKRRTYYGDTIPMFSVKEKKPAQIDWLASTPEHSHLVGPLLGLAAKHVADNGWDLSYSDDLSEDSSKVVQHALKLGLVQPNPGNPDAEPTNQIASDEHLRPDFIDRALGRVRSQQGTKEVDPSEGSEYIRQKLRSSRSGGKKSPVPMTVGQAEIAPHSPSCWSQDHAVCSCHANAEEAKRRMPELPFG
jgi:hypothetical protein